MVIADESRGERMISGGLDRDDVIAMILPFSACLLW